MKKRIIAAIVAGVLVAGLGVAGCSSKGSSNSSSESSQEAQQASQKQSDSDYAVSIDRCEIGTDYAGKKAAIVTYTWTNDSDKATSFMVAINAKAFQNGVQLDSAIGSNIDSQDRLNDIKPGVSQTVQEAYVLDDDSDVTIECSELISFSDELLAEATFKVA